MSSSRAKTDAGKSGRGKTAHSPEDADEASANIKFTDSSSANITVIQGMLESVKNDICQKIDLLSSDLRSEIVTVRQEVKDWLGPLQQKVYANADTIRELERSASDHSDRITEMQSVISTLQKQVVQLDAKCEDLEGRSRRNNIRLVGLPEGVEGSHPADFVSQLLQSLLHLQEKPLLDRAHRTLRERPRKGEPPRPLVIRVHYFQARDEILRRAAQLSPLMHDGNKISVFADYTTAVVKKRAAFKDSKRLLHSCPGVKFGLLFPAVLRITLSNGAVHKFEDPAAASDFIKKTVLPANT